MTMLVVMLQETEEKGRREEEGSPFVGPDALTDSPDVFTSPENYTSLGRNTLLVVPITGAGAIHSLRVYVDVMPPSPFSYSEILPSIR